MFSIAGATVHSVQFLVPTYVDIREPDVLSGVRVEEDVVLEVCPVGGQKVGHIQPRVLPVEPHGGLQGDDLPQLVDVEDVPQRDGDVDYQRSSWSK